MTMHMLGFSDMDRFKQRKEGNPSNCHYKYNKSQRSDDECAVSGD